MRLGDLDALKKTLYKTEGITWDSWKTVEKVIDSAPTVEPRIEYGTDGQSYRLFMSGGQVVPDMLQGWRYEERPHWVKIFENPYTNGYVCSVCGHKIQVTEQFLPNVTECEACGADMKGGAE